MSERTLEYEVGNLVFHWDITAQEILIYEAETHWWLGKLAVMGPDGRVIPFEQEAFDQHCDWFIRQGIARSRQAVEAATKLEEFMDSKRDEEEGWDDLALYAAVARRFIERYGESS